MRTGPREPLGKLWMMQTVGPCRVRLQLPHVLHGIRGPHAAAPGADQAVADLFEDVVCSPAAGLGYERTDGDVAAVEELLQLHLLGLVRQRVLHLQPEAVIVCQVN